MTKALDKSKVDVSEHRIKLPNHSILYDFVTNNTQTFYNT